jgi:hypothetical protein
MSKPELIGTVTEITHLNDIDFKCKVYVEPSAQILSHVQYDINKYDRLILLNGLEPVGINYITNEIIQNGKYFDSIHSYDTKVLELCNNSRLFCFGSCWVLTDKDGNMVNTKKEYYDFFQSKNKKFKTSFIKSNKCQLEGHKLRHNVNFNGCRGELMIPTQRIDTKIPLFIDSMFHLAIENSKCINYFTEKLIDCFMSRTVPIYWGCPNIGEYFNTDGMILFNTIEELSYILTNLTPDQYLNRLDIIEENYHRAIEYAFFWDRLNDIILDTSRPNC